MSITPGTMLAGPSTKTTTPVSKFLIVATNLNELNLIKPKEFCFGITQDNNYLYYFVNGSWIRQGN
jgi:hypothetical protein